MPVSPVTPGTEACVWSGSAKQAFQESLHLVHVGLADQKRVRAISGPFNHGAVIELHILMAEHLRQDEPVGRRPVTGVAIADNRQQRVKIAIDRIKLREALQPVRLNVIGVFLKDQLGPGNAAACGRLRMFRITKELLGVRPRRVGPVPASTIWRTSSVVT